MATSIPSFSADGPLADALTMAGFGAYRLLGFSDPSMS